MKKRLEIAAFIVVATGLIIQLVPVERSNPSASGPLHTSDAVALAKRL